MHAGEVEGKVERRVTLKGDQAGSCIRAEFLIKLKLLIDSLRSRFTLDVLYVRAQLSTFLLFHFVSKYSVFVRAPSPWLCMYHVLPWIYFLTTSPRVNWCSVIFDKFLPPSFLLGANREQSDQYEIP